MRIHAARVQMVGVRAGKAWFTYPRGITPSSARLEPSLGEQRPPLAKRGRSSAGPVSGSQKQKWCELRKNLTVRFKVREDSRGRLRKIQQQLTPATYEHCCIISRAMRVTWTSYKFFSHTILRSCGPIGISICMGTVFVAISNRVSSAP